MPIAHVISHRDVAEELGHIGSWLEARDFEIRRIFREELTLPKGADVLIALGSPHSVANGYLQRPAEEEIELVRTWLESGRPYLGVCFGAQVLACASGGSVRRMKNTFRGFTKMTVPSQTSVDVSGPWALWHEDAITAPLQSQILAQVAHGDTMFHIGNAWGMQPHIEFTSDIMRRLVDKAHVPTGDWEELYEDLRGDEDGHQLRAHALLDATLGSVSLTL